MKPTCMLYVCGGMSELCVMMQCTFVCSKVKELEEELHVVTNSLRSLEISENKVCDISVD